MPATADPRPPAPSATPWDVLCRAGRLLSGWWPLRPGPAMPTRQVQLYALLSILDDAVDAQPATDHAVDACGERDNPPSGAVVDAARQLSVYHHLMLRLRALRLDHDLQRLQERASRLLAHHEWTLNQALTVACAPRSAGQELTGLGTAGDDLRALRDEVQARAKGTWRAPEGPRGQEAPP
ncbi:hypothetical protein ABTX35_00645 [Streptomyces sp. NPDC096080]|uniref:hypothetical protein n=1 Tax=Streptomyces sp. NPDC096080 TaxID=3156693 RepID=UPI00331A6098